MFLTSLSVGPIETNCYILACDQTKKAIIIDPGDEAERILNLLQQNNLTPVTIVNTHGHFDHTSANADLKKATEASLLIHEKDAFMLPILSETAAIFGLSVPNSPNADAFLIPGQTIDIGTLQLEIRHVPGHTPGSIALYAKGFVFVGDSLFAGSIGRTDLPGGNLKELVESIRKELFTLPADTVVYSGHGPSTTIGEEIATNPFLT